MCSSDLDALPLKLAQLLFSSTMTKTVCTGGTAAGALLINSTAANTRAKRRKHMSHGYFFPSRSVCKSGKHLPRRARLA